MEAMRTVLVRSLLFFGLVGAIAGCSALLDVDALSTEDGRPEGVRQEAEGKDVLEPPPEPTEPLDGGAPPEGDASTLMRFSGSLDTTVTVPFGGEVYCAYKVTFKTVSFEMLVSNGTIVQAESRGTRLEELGGTCPYDAAPPGAQEHVLSENLEGDAGGARHLTLIGKPENSPRTTLVADVLANGAGGYDVNLTWTRTDQTAQELNWTVRGRLVATAR